MRLNKFVSWISEILYNLFYYYYQTLSYNTRCDIRCDTLTLGLDLNATSVGTTAQFCLSISYNPDLISSLYG